VGPESTSELHYVESWMPMAPYSIVEVRKRCLDPRISLGIFWNIFILLCLMSAVKGKLPDIDLSRWLLKAKGIWNEKWKKIQLALLCCFYILRSTNCGLKIITKIVSVLTMYRLFLLSLFSKWYSLNYLYFTCTLLSVISHLEII
jgi:hypothetical protein